MLGLAELQKWEWLVTENIPPSHAYIKVFHEFTLDGVRGYWYQGEIVAMNDSTSSLSVNISVLFYQITQVDLDIVLLLPTKRLLPAIQTTSLKTSILRALARLILLEVRQSIGAYCHILGSGALSEALLIQSRQCGLQVNMPETPWLDAIIIASPVAIDYQRLLQQSRDQAIWLVLSPVPFDAEVFINSQKLIELRILDPALLLSSDFWHSEATAYLRMNFYHSFLAEQTVLPTAASSLNTKIVALPEIRVAGIGLSGTTQQQLRTLLQPQWQWVGHLIHPASQEKLVMSSVVKNWVDFDALLQADTHLVIIEDPSLVSLKQLEKLIAQGKHILIKPDFVSTLDGWQCLNHYSIPHHTFVMPYLPVLHSRLMQELLAGLQGRVEPLHLTLRVIDNPCQPIASLLLSYFIIGKPVLEIRQTQVAESQCIQCRFADASLASIWLIQRTVARPCLYLEVSCQVHTWQIHDWRELRCYTTKGKKSKKAANYQTGHIECLNQVLQALQHGQYPDYYLAWRAWVKAIDSMKIGVQ